MKTIEVLFLYCTLCAFLCLYCSIPLSSNNDIRTEPKHIVFLSNLLLLFLVCHFCRTGNKPDATATQSGTAGQHQDNMQQPWLQEGIYLDQSTFNARDQATGWEFPHMHGYTICWWVLHKDEDHIPAYGTGLCVIKYFLQAPTGNLFSCTKCYSIRICKFAVGYATSIYFLGVEIFFFSFGLTSILKSSAGDGFFNFSYFSYYTISL